MFVCVIKSCAAKLLRVWDS